MNISRTLLHLTVLIGLLLCGNAIATTYTWTAQSAPPDNWSNALNWQNAAAPVSATTTDIIFQSGRLNTNQDIANPFQLHSMTFNAAGFNLTGQPIAFNGTGFIQQNSTSLTIAAPLVLGSDTAYDGAGPATLSGVISGSGALTKNGSGILTLSAANTFTGPTNINAGQIKMGHGSALRESTIFLNLNNGLDLNAAAPTLGNLSGPGNLDIGPTFFSIGANNASPAAYSGVITGQVGTMTKVGTGTLTLTGQGSNFHGLSTERGTLTLSGGSMTLSGFTEEVVTNIDVLEIGKTGPGSMIVGSGGVLNTVAGGRGVARIFSSTMTVTGANSRWDARQIFIGTSSTQAAVIVEAGATLNAANISVSTDRASLTVQTGGTVMVPQISLGGAGLLTLRSNGTLITSTTRVLTNLNSINIDGGTLRTGQLIGDGLVSPTFLSDPAGGTALIIDGATGSATYSGPISGDGSIVKSGGSTQTLSGANTYTGRTTVNGGTLILPNANSSAYTANSGGKLVLGFGNFGFSSLRTNPGGEIEYQFANIIGGFFRGANHDIGGVTSFNGSTFAVDSAIRQGQPLALNNVTNSGVFTSNSTLTWDGGSNSAAGSLFITTTARVSSFENTGQITIARRATLSNSDTRLVSGAGGRITIEEQAALELGETTLDLNGSLLVNNGVISGTTNINFGALAKGSGVYGEVNVTDGGRFSPGNSPGAVTTGTANWTSGGSYVVEIADALGGAGAGWDLWRVDGQLKVNAASGPTGRFTISLSSLDGLAENFDPTRDYSWTILHASDGIVGLDPAELILDTSGFKNYLGAGYFTLESTTSHLVVRFSAVPEPVSLSALCVCGLWAIRRRCRGCFAQGGLVPPLVI